MKPQRRTREEPIPAPPHPPAQDSRKPAPHPSRSTRPAAVATAGPASIAAVVMVLLLVSACGYRLQGTGTFLPPHIRTISIPMFKNLTTRYELDVRLTQAVIQEIVARGKVRIVPDAESADAVMAGEIHRFDVNPVAISVQGSADRYNISVVTKVILRDRVRQKILFEAPSFTFTEEYQVPPEADFESVETEAIGRIAGRFARSLVLNILEGF